jgi:hypothetical protein
LQRLLKHHAQRLPSDSQALVCFWSLKCWPDSCTACGSVSAFHRAESCTCRTAALVGLCRRGDFDGHCSLMCWSFAGLGLAHMWVSVAPWCCCCCKGLCLLGGRHCWQQHTLLVRAGSLCVSTDHVSLGIQAHGKAADLFPYVESRPEQCYHFTRQACLACVRQVYLSARVAIGCVCVTGILGGDSCNVLRCNKALASCATSWRLQRCCRLYAAAFANAQLADALCE